VVIIENVNKKPRANSAIFTKVNMKFHYMKKESLLPKINALRYMEAIFVLSIQLLVVVDEAVLHGNFE
jgi:hypothetical protein